MNWKSIIATAIVTGLVTIGTGMALFWFQKEKIEITYNSIQSFPFDDEKSKLFIEQIEIINSGDKIAENVIFLARYKDAIIQRHKISVDFAIPYNETANNSSVSLNISLLNPGEKITISVLYQSASSTKADITLRAKGALGKEIGKSNKNSESFVILPLIAAYMGLFAAFLVNKRGRSLFKSVLKNGPIAILAQDRQREIFASKFALLGNASKARYYLNIQERLTYWSEADVLGAEAISSETSDDHRQEIVAVLKEIVEQVNIAPTSKAIVLFNIAKIIKNSSGIEESFEPYIDRAKKIDAEEIERRVKIDRSFAT